MSARRHIAVSCLCAALALLSSCKLSQENPITRPVDSFLDHRGETEARLSTAANAAIAAGKTDEALPTYENLYKLHLNDPEIAVNYAQLLRKTGQAAQAQRVLEFFIWQRKGIEKDRIEPMVLNEYAAGLIAQGRFSDAERFLNRVLEDSKARKFHNDAYNLMGVSLDARGQHKEAEQMFRQALDGWKGDPTSVMNNLGLCLASEGSFDEALSTLRRALVMAPAKESIARNIQLVESLRDAVVPKAPVSLHGKKTPKKKKN